MDKCPRCENEQLREDYKYCPICGLEISMSVEDVIKHLEGLKLEAIDLSKDNEGWMKEIVALDIGIKVIKRFDELERTAQEVPVQEV